MLYVKVCFEESIDEVNILKAYEYYEQFIFRLCLILFISLLFFAVFAVFLLLL